jgi:hypothetical protein
LINGINVLSQVSFHPVFIADIAQVTTVDEMFDLITKYGTHYYQSITLGGTLQQITTMDSVYESQTDSSQVCIKL